MNVSLRVPKCCCICHLIVKRKTTNRVKKNNYSIKINNETVKVLSRPDLKQFWDYIIFLV